MTGEDRTAPGEAPRAIIVMGVAGSGKSTVAARLARAIDVPFIEGDRLHPAENVARMAGGQPLDDAHRAGWLDAIAREINAAAARADGAVVACSALKRSYRDRLRAACRSLAFIHLDVSHETARRRVAGRRRHFMPASLIDSQFADLEPPADDEGALTVDGTLPMETIVASAVAWLDLDMPRNALRG